MRRSTSVIIAFLLSLSVVGEAVRAQESPQNAPAPATKSAQAPVNLNSATQAQLESLPGIGPKTATRILEYRQKNGGFKKIEELMNVKGIGEKSFLKLKALITVTPPKTDRAGTSA
ncbi:MAG: helix-hairpin-helix domain-containing protein [Acidobacteria bacterium]|nr:helix-hairpin-helix domain-containing protein [Acidobacteriota bacterium]